MANLISTNHVDTVDGRWTSLFAPEDVKVGINSTTHHWIKSNVFPTKHTNSFTFDVPAYGDAYLDLKSTHLYVMGHLEHRDGTPLEVKTDAQTKVTTVENACVVNNFLHSLFESVKCSVGTNQQEVSEPDYHYKAYMKQLWKEHNPNFSRRDVFALDIGSDIDKIDKNSGGLIRKGMVAKGKKLEMYSHLMVDLFTTEGYLMPNTPLTITLKKSTAPFYVMSEVDGKEYDFVIEDIMLEVTSVNANPSLTYEIEKRLEDVPANYKWDQLVTKQFTIPNGSFTASFAKLFEGVLPRKVCIAFVAQEALTGSYGRNPYKLHHMNLNKIALKVNDKEEMSLSPKFDQDLFLYTYERYAAWCGLEDKRRIIENKLLPYGHAMFCFDLLDGCPEGEKCSQEMLQAGVISTSMTFSKATEEPMVMLVFGYLPKELTITKTRLATIEQSQ